MNDVGMPAMDARLFEAERPRLIAVASRILGTSADAEDVVQDAWLRLAGVQQLDDPRAWLTTVTTRLCLDHLRKRGTRAGVEARVQAEAASLEPADGPEAELLRDERVGEAMQIVIDALAPAERAVVVLHDVFGYSFGDVSAVLGRSDAAVRQLASRARRKLRGSPESPEGRAARTDNREVVSAFLDAAHKGEIAKLVTMLAPDAVMQVDAAGRRMGADARYETAAAIAERFNGAGAAVLVEIDGDPGVAWFHRGALMVAFAFLVEGALVREIELIAEPDVLATLTVSRVKRA